MFYTDGKLQYRVRVEKPNPLFARHLQQAIGGVEGEIRVAMQYLFQAWGARGPKKYRDMLLNTGTEELAHIEMLATAVALNLEGAAPAVQEGMAADSPMVEAILGGMSARHFLSTGLAALPANADGVPFDMSHVYASGNLAADMYANVAAEATGRLLATRLYEMTDDPGMKDMLAFLIARDTMHQNQWLAVIEETGGAAALPIPDSFPQEQENQEFSYSFMTTTVDGGPPPPEGRWTQGPSIDTKGEFHMERAAPLGGEPMLAPPIPQGHAQTAQMSGAPGAGDQGIVDTVRKAVKGG
ncbi:MAG TPA: manganese catalase family protein [Miltoncostaeaceae bacterium]|nr:manganese catalase family protein [Miltoncostaeaceae bacterium]